MGAHYKIRAEKSGHYFTHGTLTGSTRYVWVCLHGYGQLARYFIQRFEFLDPSRHYVIAPEGLNRFYFEGVDGRPVANWMTREDRLDEIADYVLFLESLRRKTGWDKQADTRLVYFGFSQGATSLLRWLHNIQPKADYLLLWAGGFPDDIRFDHQREYFRAMPTHYFIGDHDPYISAQVINEKKQIIDQIGLDVSLHQYPGDHKVDESVLRNWVAQYLQ